MIRLSVSGSLIFIRKKATLKENVRIEVLYVLIGGNLSEERLSPEPPSKDF